MADKPRSRPLRLLHVHSSFDPGGKELRTVQLINAFGKGVMHTIASAVPGPTGAMGHIARGIPVFQINLPGLSGRPRPLKLRALAEAMKPYDLILTYNWGAMNAVLAHSAFGPSLGLAGLIHHEDGFNADEAARLKPVRNAYRILALSRAQALVVPSTILRNIALETWRQPSDKVHLVPNGVATSRFSAKPKRDVLPRLIKHPGELWLGTFAGLRAVKNLPRLVRAFATMPEPWHLVIAGEGPERAAILAEAERCHVADRVHLTGFVADPATLIGLFDLYALSSDSEQAPISVIEAMAAGLAVASPAVGDVAAILGPGNQPYLTPPGDESALAAALRELAEAPRLRKSIGMENRARARACFDQDTMVSRHAALYAQVMGRERFP
ncbi:MAG: glycosyltransferase family 4 protein [Novosphingobium sp.]|nr:glycosyltransferase family 4 protein [Novosphingobium sp.]